MGKKKIRKRRSNYTGLIQSHEQKANDAMGNGDYREAHSHWQNAEHFIRKADRNEQPAG